MQGTIGEFLRDCEAADFGERELSNVEATFYRRFGNEILSLCRSLPASAQTDAILFLMSYSGTKLGENPDFFANYYPPIWSILYRLSHEPGLPTGLLTEADVTDAVATQSMAMFLHSLDDHLVDGQVSVTPLTLLLRSRAWTVMNNAAHNMAGRVGQGEETVRRFLDDYYSGFQDSEQPKTLDDYCDLFRRQMAIVMIAPVLLSMKMTGNSDFARDIEIAFGSFGIAWRLLDDIRDIREDMEKGAKSSVYLCLSETIRTHWNRSTVGDRTGTQDSANVVLGHILEHGLVDSIRERICTELDSAASLVEVHNMRGLAGEFRCLAQPLKNRLNSRIEDNGRLGIASTSER
ncbi:MAG: hypothetical protein V1792_21125 [Pseudomonadota bacterium]